MTRLIEGRLGAVAAPLLLSVSLSAGLLFASVGSAAAGGAQARDSTPDGGGLAEKRLVGWSSSNWAGYVVRNGPFTSVGGQWWVPAVSTTRPGFSAAWIGIGGVSEHQLIQVGTEQDSRHGQASYFAWWEVLPAPAVRITAFSVRPGDHITATIRGVAGRWRITISNAGKGSFTATHAFPAAGGTAEWIVEAPTVIWGQTPLARHTPVTFDHITANGVTPGLRAIQAGASIQDGVRVATPSIPDSDGDGFTVQAAGTAPPPPLS
jgi:hypothetical protein